MPGKDWVDDGSSPQVGVWTPLPSNADTCHPNYEVAQICIDAVIIPSQITHVKSHFSQGIIHFFQLYV